MWHSVVENNAVAQKKSLKDCQAVTSGSISGALPKELKVGAGSVCGIVGKSRDPYRHQFKSLRLHSDPAPC